MKTAPRSRTAALATLAAILLLLAGAATAWAAEEAPVPAHADAQGLLKALLGIVLALLGFVGAGAVTLVLRVILPGLAGAADAALARLSTRRLVFSGILPLVGAALLAQAVHLTGSPVLGGVFAIVVVLPIALATIVGAMAALPHLGAQVWKTSAAPLARAAIGGLVLGLAMLSWVLPPLGVLVSVLVAGWFLGIGLGGCTRGPVAADGDGAEAPGD